MLIAHSADHHLGFQKFAGARSPLRKRDFYKCFISWVDEVIKRKADLALLAGDLFDSPDPDNESLFVAASQLMRLVEAGVNVIAVSGNHDTPKSSRTHIYQVLDKLPIISVYNNKQSNYEYFFGNFGITAVPWWYGEIDWKKLYVNDVIVIHTPSGEFNTPYRKLCEEEIASRWRYMALGDWHKRCNPVANAWYPGALEHCSFGEQSEQTGAIFFNLNKPTEVEFWDSPSRRMVTLDFFIEESTTEEINRELERYSDACVRLRLHGSSKIIDIRDFEWHPLLKREFVNSEQEVTGPQFAPGNLINDWNTFCEDYKIQKDIRRYGRKYLL